MVPIFRPSIRRADMDAVLTRLAEDSIGPGELAREFSSTIAKYLGRRHAVAMRSYGQAMTGALLSLGLPSGSRVGCSVLAPGAVQHSIEAADLVAVPIDVQKHIPVLPSPLNVDYQELNLSALVVDTRLGYVAELEVLQELRIPIVEDISEGLGGNTGTTMAGATGDITLIGTEPEHIVTSGGGAVVVTNNSRRLSVLHALLSPEMGEPALPDMNAALGLTQMKQLERFLERRREIAAKMLRVLQRTNHVLPLQGGEGENVFFALPVLVQSSPREVEQYARTHGVTAIRAFQYTILEMLDAAEEEVSHFPNALTLASKMVLFPLFPALGSSEQERIERVLATMP